jgi:hypothetical protein
VTRRMTASPSETTPTVDIVRRSDGFGQSG